jgi:hypothetical protein
MNPQRKRYIASLLIILSCITGCAAFFRPTEILLLDARIGGFAISHGGRLPSSWLEMSKYYGEENNADYTTFINNLGHLRWSWKISEIPPDGKFIYIKNPKYKRFEAKLNQGYLKTVTWAKTQKFHDWGNYNPYLYKEDEPKGSNEPMGSGR